MIQVDHMATAAYKRVQEDFVGQVTEDIVEEMMQLERVKVRFGVNIRCIKVFRRVRMSSQLKKFVIENKLIDKEWRSIIRKMWIEIHKNKEDKMREKIMLYREKLMVEELKINAEYYTKWFAENRLWQPMNKHCDICREKGHIAKQCKYTYDRLRERILKEEAILKEKMILSEKGKNFAIEREDNKRQKLCIESKDKLIEM
ncbi:hypothetical protein BDAP_000188 [Binucleata daphniae]